MPLLALALPMPIDELVSFPGSRRTSATNSAAVSAGTLGLATSSYCNPSSGGSASA